MNVLVTGAAGQLGRALVNHAPPGIDLVPVDRAQMDLGDFDAVRRVIGVHQPAVVINTAAYTAVDQAESDKDAAFLVNSAAVGVIAQCCQHINARLIHLSTDFVFDGERGSPYRPEDQTRPLNAYGASKLAGERQIAAVSGLQWLVLRTAWVYAPFGRNFMLTMLRLFRERSVVDVVCDQTGTPTSALSLTRCIWRAVIEHEGAAAILHYTDAGVASWYDFAVAIYEEARALGLVARDVEIRPITSAQYPTAARRPAYSVLDKQSTLARLHLPSVHWRGALREVMQEIAL